jgi:hypothetical protein
MYNVTLKKLIGGENVRTDEVIGACEQYPVLGERFIMIAPSLSKHGSCRVVSTSPVEEISEGFDNTLTVKTLNSTYHLTITQET